MYYIIWIWHAVSVFVGIRDGSGLIYKKTGTNVDLPVSQLSNLFWVSFRGFTCQWAVKEVFFVNILQNFLICAKAAKEPK